MNEAERYAERILAATIATLETELEPYLKWVKMQRYKEMPCDYSAHGHGYPAGSHHQAITRETQAAWSAISGGTMKYSEQMMRLLSNSSLAKMALAYARKDAASQLGPTEMEFWDAINAELNRRGAL